MHTMKMVMFSCKFQLKLKEENITEDKFQLKLKEENITEDKFQLKLKEENITIFIICRFN